MMNTIYTNMRKDDEYETPLSAVKIIEPYLKRERALFGVRLMKIIPIL